MGARMHLDHLTLHVQRLLNSYRRWTGQELISRVGCVQEQARKLELAPFVVVSHGTQSDPIINYGNRTALNLWEVDFDTFTRMPSRETAEAIHREERAQYMTRVRSQGYVAGYKGVRISSTGKRFLIEDAVIWNILDEREELCGQGAWFDKWTLL